MTEGDALVVVVAGDAPVDVSVEPKADEVGRVNGSDVLVALAAPGLVWVALGDVEPVDVPVVPAAFDEVFTGEDDGVLAGELIGTLVCACAAAEAASHRTVAKMNGRCIALSRSQGE